MFKINTIYVYLYKRFYGIILYSFGEFCFMDEIHIGKQIKALVEERGFSITEFAKRINKSRENAYSIFSRKTLDTGLLLKISAVLEFDFFKQFSSDANSQLELIDSLRNEVKLLKELNELLRQKGSGNN